MKNGIYKLLSQGSELCLCVEFSHFLHLVRKVEQY